MSDGYDGEKERGRVEGGKSCEAKGQEVSVMSDE